VTENLRFTKQKEEEMLDDQEYDGRIVYTIDSIGRKGPMKSCLSVDNDDDDDGYTQSWFI
jgi:hypothetical protein